MSRLTWDGSGEKKFEAGVSKGVLYVASNGQYGAGVAWNGLTAVNESPDGADETALYADNIKYASMRAAEEFNATIEAYTYPPEFLACDGGASIANGITIGQQARNPFGFSYRTEKGDDVSPIGSEYIIHLVYGATASPSEKNYETINDSPDAITFSWELSANPVPVSGTDANGNEYKPTATLNIDSEGTDPAIMKRLEALLYGAEDFSESQKYAVGDIVGYGADDDPKAMYICKTAVTTAGAWDSSKWEQIDASAEARLLLPNDVLTLINSLAS